VTAQPAADTHPARAIHGFDPSQIVAASEYYTIWRAGSAVAMEVRGPVDDARSDGWRAALAHEFARAGHPRFYAMDVSACDATLSAAAAWRTIRFVSSTLRRIEAAALYSRGTDNTVLLVRAMLRAVGMPNIALCVDRAMFHGCIDRMHAG
jgi:hypothetical protein